MAWSEDAQGWYEAVTVVCQACAALEAFQAENAKHAEPGTAALVVPVWEPHERPQLWDGHLTHHSHD